MKKRTWVFRGRMGEVRDALATATSRGAAAAALGVNRSTIARWIKTGKVLEPGGRPGGTIGPSPEGWAAAVRQAYDLDATEDTLVSLAEQARVMAFDPFLSAAIRLSAMARFAQLALQLDLEVPDDGHVEATTTRARLRRIV